MSSRFVGLDVPDKSVNFRDPCLNRSSEIQLETVTDGTFDVFSKCHKCRPEEAGDVIYGAAEDWVDTDVRVKFGDARSNCAGDIRLPHFHFMTDDERRTRVDEPCDKTGKPREHDIITEML